MLQKMKPNRLFTRITSAVLSAVTLISSLSVAVCAMESEYSDNSFQRCLTGEDTTSEYADTQSHGFDLFESDKLEISSDSDNMENIEYVTESAAETAIIEENNNKPENSGPIQSKIDKTESDDIYDDKLNNENRNSDVHKVEISPALGQSELTDNIPVKESVDSNETNSEDFQQFNTDGEGLTLYAASAANCAFKEADGITFQYCVGTVWTDFYGKTDILDHIDGVRIQSGAKPYYLKYRTKDVGKDNYRPFVTSEEDDYAGWYGINMSQLEIQVYLQNGQRAYDDYIVMYRVKVNDMGWLDWVSNGSLDVMREIKNGFSLDGELDGKSTYAGWSKNEKIEAMEIHVYERASLDPIPSENAIIINAPYLNQYDVGMPNGCESVSAVMALQYIGIPITPEEFVSNYLDMGNAPSGGIGPDPNIVFVGDPRSPGGWGCYAPVILKALNKISGQYNFYAYNLSGQLLEDLCSIYVNKGIPVIIWATVDMTDYFEYRYWSTPEGSDVQYNNKLHCLLLVGYDENNYYFHDPMRKAYKGFSKSKVDEAYNLLGKQAVVIIKSGEAPFIPVVEPYEKTLEELSEIIGSQNTEKLLISFSTTVIALKIIKSIKNISKVFTFRTPV